MIFPSTLSCTWSGVLRVLVIVLEIGFSDSFVSFLSCSILLVPSRHLVSQSPSECRHFIVKVYMSHFITIIIGTDSPRSLGLDTV